MGRARVREGRSSTQRKPSDQEKGKDGSMSDFIATAISIAYGTRCPETVTGCPCCDAWAQYDALKADQDKDPAKGVTAWIDEGPNLGATTNEPGIREIIMG